MTPKSLDLKIVAHDRLYSAVPMRELMRWAAQGRLAADDLVREPESETWMRVAEVPLLAAQLPAPSKGPATARATAKAAAPAAATPAAPRSGKPSSQVEVAEKIDLDAIGSVSASDDWPRQELEEPTMDMLPMIDVIFQLLIFFMFSNQLANPNPIETPEAIYGMGVTPDGKQMILIDDTGNYFLGETTRDDARIQSVDLVVDRVRENAEMLGSALPVIINAHKAARHFQIRVLVERLAELDNVAEIKLGVEEKQ